MTLGANTRAVVTMVLRRVAVLLALGSAIGLMLTLWAAQFTGTLLFRVARTASS